MSEALNKLIAKRDEIQELIDELMQDTADLRVERLSAVFKRIDSMPPMAKYETGIDWFDYEMGGGFSEGSFINIAGEGFSGKTTFVLEVLQNISKYKQVLFFSFEMYERLIRIRLKNLSSVQQGNLLIEQKRNELGAIESVIKAYSKAGGKFIAIDSRMKIKVAGKSEEFQKNSDISSRLSKLCQETGVIIILINQISESDLKTGRMSLKGSGDQFYDSDVVLFIVVNKDETRTMVCTKDRINQKKWSRQMPFLNIKQEKHEKTETYDFSGLI